MARFDRQQTVLTILNKLDGMDGLKRLFWQELSYERENKPLSIRQWRENAKSAIAEDPILFANGGEENAFHIVYCRLATPDLKRGPQRRVVNQLLRDHPYALFVFSNESRPSRQLELLPQCGTVLEGLEFPRFSGHLRGWCGKGKV